MRKLLILGAALTLLADPALAQYSGSGQSAGGPLGSYARRAGAYGGYAHGPYFGSYGAVAPVYFYAAPPAYGYYPAAPPAAYYGAPIQYGHHPGYYSYGYQPAYYGGPGYSGGAVAAGIIGGIALGALAARSYRHPRRYYRW